MAILIEAISVVIIKKRILEQYSGWDAFVTDVPNRTLCADNDIVRVGFMSPADVEVFVKHLETQGLKYVVDGKAVDIAVVDQLHGILAKCDWLEYGTIHLQDSETMISSCSFKGSDNSTLTLYTPENWSYEKSLSKSHYFAYSDSIEKGLKFIRHENGLDIYSDNVSGKEVYVGRTSMSANNHGDVPQDFPQDSVEPLTPSQGTSEQQGAKVEHNLGHKFAGLGIIGIVLFIVFGVAQIYAGYIGIAHHLGGLWAGLAIGAAVIFRFTLPITIGSFFGAMNVWGWHWIGAALFAAPGLLFVIPGALASILSVVRR